MIGELNLCIGPMFAGKTTYLLNKIDELINNNVLKEDIIVIKSSIDNRYSEEFIISHDNKKYESIQMMYLSGIYDMGVLNMKKKYIFIDEGQFFIDIYDVVNNLVKDGHNIYISSLNGDSNMELFGDIYKLIPKCDNIYHIKAKCKCGLDASFSKKTNNDENIRKQIIIGGSKLYSSVCRKCYNDENYIIKNDI